MKGWQIEMSLFIMGLLQSALSQCAVWSMQYPMSYEQDVVWCVQGLWCSMMSAVYSLQYAVSSTFSPRWREQEDVSIFDFTHLYRWPTLPCICPWPAYSAAVRMPAEWGSREATGCSWDWWEYNCHLEGILLSLTAGGWQSAGALLARGHRGGQGLPGGPGHCMDDQQVTGRNGISQFVVVSPTRLDSPVDHRRFPMQLRQNTKYTHSEILP